MHSNLRLLGWFSLPLIVFALIILVFQPLARAAPIYAIDQEASLVLGQASFDTVTSSTAADKMEAPSRVAIDPTSNKVFVADGNNHRVLRFASLASLNNGAAAEAVLGQPDFASNDSGTDQNSFDTPAGLTVDSAGRLWVADSNNNRVLRFDDAASKTSGAAADGVLGQPDFTSSSIQTSQSGLNYPLDLVIDNAGHLWIVDNDNNRLLRFDDAAGKANGADADGVLGQADFTSSTSGNGQSSLTNPYGIDVDSAGRLWVADAFNHRLLRFDDAAAKINGANADGVLGQSDFTGDSPATSQSTFRHPTDAAVDSAGNLWVADYFNHRLLRFDDAAAKTNGASADHVLGQTNFTSSTSGNGQSKVNYPLGIAVNSADYLLVADTENNRILFFGASNTPPAISGLDDRSIAAGETAGPFSFTVGDAETSPDALTLSASSSDESLISPTGISFDGSGADRSISLTPTDGISGTATITVTVNDGTLTADASFILTVRRAPQFGSTDLAAGAYGSAYSQSLTVESGDTPISYDLDGDLPTGLAFDDDTATFSGIPTETGSFSLTITADNDVGEDSRNITLTIDQAPLNVTIDNASRDYGADNPAFNGSISGLVNGDIITATYITTATAASPAGSYAIVPQLHDPDNKLAGYDLSSTSGILTINKVALSVTADDAGRSYGAANPAFSGTLSGVIDGDNITASYTTTAVADSPVGSYDIVPQLHDPDNRLASYDVTSTSGTLTVTRKALVITARDETRRLDEPNPEFVALYTGFIDGEDESVLTSLPELSTTADEESPEGTYDITVSGAAASNYEISYQPGTLTIVYRFTPDISWEPEDLVYGTKLGVAQFNATAEYDGSTLNGRFSYNPFHGTMLDAGNGQVLELTFRPIESGLYEIVTVQAQVDVAPAALTVTVDAATKVYGTENPAFTGTISGTVAGDNITAGYSSNATAASVPGEYPIEASLNDPDQRLENYEVTLEAGTLTVTNAPLAVAANDLHIYSGQALPELSYTVDGLVNGDTVAGALSGALATTATATSEPGEYPITRGDLAAEHYDITFTAGTLTIAPSPPVSITELRPGRQFYPLVRGTAQPGMQVRVTLSPQTDQQATADVVVFETTAAADGTWEIDCSCLAPVQGSLPAGGYPGGTQIDVLVEIIGDDNSILASTRQTLEMQSVVYLPFIAR